MYWSSILSAGGESHVAKGPVWQCEWCTVNGEAEIWAPFWVRKAGPWPLRVHDINSGAPCQGVSRAGFNLGPFLDLPCCVHSQASLPPHPVPSPNLNLLQPPCSWDLLHFFPALFHPVGFFLGLKGQCKWWPWNSQPSGDKQRVWEEGCMHGWLWPGTTLLGPPELHFFPFFSHQLPLQPLRDTLWVSPLVLMAPHKWF